MIEHTDISDNDLIASGKEKRITRTKMTSESTYSTGSSYLNIAVPTQDIEDNMLVINADTVIPCETPRERLPVFDRVNMNEYQHPQHPQQSDNAMALMDNTGHGSAYALTRLESLEKEEKLSSTVQARCKRL